MAVVPVTTEDNEDRVAHSWTCLSLILVLKGNDSPPPPPIVALGKGHPVPRLGSTVELTLQVEVQGT